MTSSEPLPRGPAGSAIAAELRFEARLRMVAAAAATCGAFGVAFLVGRHRARTAEEWAVAVVLFASAVGLAALSRALPLAVWAAGPCVAVATVLWGGAPGPLDALHGLECVSTEAGCAAVVVGGVLLALRRGTTSLGVNAAAAGATAGALAGAAALELTCRSGSATMHALVFHAVGLLLGPALAAVGWRVSALARHRVSRV